MVSKSVNLIVMGCLVALLLTGAFNVGRESLSPTEIVRRYQMVAYINPAMWGLKWLNIKTSQNPDDVWIIQEIISEVRPDFIVETGTAYGGSAAIWAMILR